MGEMKLAAKARGRRVSGIERVFQILDYLTERGGPATAYDIAGAIKAPTSTVYEIVETLIDKQALVRNEERGQVFLGPKLHFYGLGYSRDLNVASVFQSAIEKLARATRETVQICGRDDDKMVVEMMEEGDGHFQVSSRVGTRVPWNWTASGHLLVGYLPQHERARLIARAHPSPTGKAETDPQRLEERCLKARARRIAVQINESGFSVACIAAPIVAPGGKCIATISLVVPEAHAHKNGEEFAVKVRAAAAEVEHAMGWDVAAPAAVDFAARRRVGESAAASGKPGRGARAPDAWMTRI
jgi:DNA-binding IclR family transcriptional regulator